MRRQPHSDESFPAPSWRRLSRIAAVAPTVLGEDGRWLADAINERLAGTSKTLDDALRLQCRGGVSARVANLNNERNELLRDYATRFLSTEAHVARALFDAMTEFETRQWPRLSSRSTCPAQLEGTASGLLFEIFRTGAKIPGPKQLNRILTGAGHSMAALNVRGTAA